MRIADSSVLVAFLDATEVAHAAAADQMCGPSAIWIPFSILCETSGLLARRFFIEAARSATARLVSMANVRVVPDPEPSAAVDRFMVPRGRLSLADAAVVQACRIWRMPPLTFDREILAAVDGLPT